MPPVITPFEAVLVGAGVTLFLGAFVAGVGWTIRSYWWWRAHCWRRREGGHVRWPWNDDHPEDRP